ncbi:MAG: hypothetical protein HQK71_12660 [Desulfamplus sp.]|nr:hypothetical protein [Desulfamplus sp.]
MNSIVLRIKTIRYRAYLFGIALFYLFIISPFTAFSETDQPSGIKKIAIIPFEINSQKDIDYIKGGVLQMLSSRLSWKERIVILPSNSEESQLDYIIRGSITEFAGAFSVDATVDNLSKKSSLSFFAQADTLKDIIPSVEILSAKINKDVFGRETAELQLIDEQKNREALNNIRSNPEKLMPLVSIEGGEEQKAKRPFWKFWAKDSQDDDILIKNSYPSSPPNQVQNGQEEKVVIQTELDPEDDDEFEKDKKPFWKFW